MRSQAAASRRLGVKRRAKSRLRRIRALVRAIEQEDEQTVARLTELSRSRRAFAPLALVVGAFAMLLHGVRLLLSNWRLTLVQLLPAVPIMLAIVALTCASFFLNAVFAFAISRPGRPEVRPALARARRRPAPALIAGVALGVPLAVSTSVVTRWERPWFTLSLGAVVGAMMVSYVAVPARLIGMRTTYSGHDKLAATAIGAAVGTVVCTPPYALGRLGLLMLGTKALLIPGVIALVVGVTLQAGATGAVRAVRLSASLTAGHRSYTHTDVST
jgi:putative flippase GtrA